MRFNFTGKFGANTLDSRVPYLREGTTKSGNKYKTLNAYIEAAQNNRAGIELFGMESDVIKTMDSDNNKIELSWDDRFDQDVVNKVASYKKNVINVLDDDRKSFVSPYDAVEYVVNNIDEFKGKKVTVTGQANKNYYNGSFSTRFTIQNIYLAGEDKKNQLQCTDIFYFTKDSFDTADWKDEKKLIINGWINTYVDKDNGNKYVPQTLIFDCSKVDFENEKHVKLVNFRLKQIGCALESGKIKVNIKNSVYKIAAVMTYQNGAEEVPFDESTLTQNQKEAISLGLKTIDDFKPAGSIYGERVTVFKLSDFDLRGDYEDGYVDTEMTINEFEDEIFSVSEEETLDEVIEKAEKTEEPKNESADEDPIEDLFS